MRLIQLELKHLVKTRAAWLLAILALLLTILLAFADISYARYYDLDDSGEERTVTGLEAIKKRREQLAPLEGTFTPEMIKSAFETYHALFTEYGNIDDIPLDLYYEQIYPIERLLYQVREVYVDENTGIPLELHEIPPEDAARYYEQRIARLEEYLAYSYDDAPAAVKNALNINERVQTPFAFHYGIGYSSADEYLTFAIFLAVLICIFIAAPIFSSDYVSGADDIFRCTRYGRTRLGIVKVLAALMVCTGLFVACIGVYLIISCTAYGWGSLAATLQLFKSSISIAPITMGGLLIILAVSGLLSGLAVISFTLFLSSKIKSTLAVLGITLSVTLLPTIISIMGNGSNMANWIKILLPSGGIGLTNSILFEIVDLKFMEIGPLAIWSPYLMIAVTVVEIPIFLLLAVRAYGKHQSN